MVLRSSPALQVRVFLSAILDHALYPYSLVWMFPRDGFRGLVNREFWPSREQWLVNPSSFYFTCRSCVDGVFRVLIHILFVLVSATRLSGRGVLSTVLLFEAFHLMRCVVIALKYAYLTRAERVTIFTGTFAESFTTRNSVQVLSSCTPRPAARHADASRLLRALTACSCWSPCVVCADLVPSPALYIAEIERLGYSRSKRRARGRCDSTGHA